MAAITPIRCVTWNVHRAKGTDGRRDPDRIEALIADEIAPRTPDVFALQEADEECPPHAGIFNVESIAATTQLAYIHKPLNLRWGPQSDGFLGTILFVSSRLSVTYTDVIDLPGHCHRGAVAAEARIGDREVRIMSMHLSLSQPLRVVQMRIIGQFLRRRPDMPTLLLGDFNEWRPWGGMMFHHWVLGTRFTGPSRASFPSRKPLFPLDRIMVDRNAQVKNVSTIRSEQALIASDHLPVYGEVTIK